MDTFLHNSLKQCTLSDSRGWPTGVVLTVFVYIFKTDFSSFGGRKDRIFTQCDVGLHQYNLTELCESR